MSAENQLTSMNISLPASQKHYVRERAAASGCSTPSEYMRRLIHEDQERRAQSQLERLLLEGLDSGSPQAMTAEDWKDIRLRLAERLAKRTGTDSSG